MWIDGSPEEIKPGMLCLMKDDALVVVGHVNENAGVCDHCSAGAGFREAIAAYWILWEGPDVEWPPQLGMF